MTAEEQTVNESTLLTWGPIWDWAKINFAEEDEFPGYLGLNGFVVLWAKVRPPAFTFIGWIYTTWFGVTQSWFLYLFFLLPSGTILTWVTVARKVENKKADELYTIGCEYRKSWKKKICKKSDKWPKMAPVQSMLPLELPRHLNAVIGMHLRWTKYRTCCAYWNGCACVWLGNPTWSLSMTLAYIKCFAEMKPTPEKKSYATRHRWSDILCATFYLISC